MREVAASCSRTHIHSRSKNCTQRLPTFLNSIYGNVRSTTAGQPLPKVLVTRICLFMHRVMKLLLKSKACDVIPWFLTCAGVEGKATGFRSKVVRRVQDRPTVVWTEPRGSSCGCSWPAWWVAVCSATTWCRKGGYCNTSWNATCTLIVIPNACSLNCGDNPLVQKEVFFFAIRNYIWVGCFSDFIMYKLGNEEPNSRFRTHNWNNGIFRGPTPYRPWDACSYHTDVYVPICSM